MRISTAETAENAEECNGRKLCDRCVKFCFYKEQVNNPTGNLSLTHASNELQDSFNKGEIDLWK
jgi:hypothetical protein